MSIKKLKPLTDYSAQINDILRESIRLAPVALLVVDNEGRVLFSNEEFELLFGYTSNELIGMPISRFMRDSDRKDHKKYFSDFMNHPEARKMGMGRDAHAVKKDGTIFPAEIGLNPIEISGQTITIAAIIDITFRRKTEQKAKELEIMKSKFFANISHEFKTPLMLILGPVEELLKKASDKESILELEIVKTNANRLLQLINQLLDLSKLDSGKFKLNLVKLDIVKYVRGLVKTFATLGKMKDITLEFKSSDKSLNIYFDPYVIEKVLSNLITNAIKFTGVGGFIKISLKTISPSVQDGKAKIQKSSVTSNESVQIVVSDTGIGISEENLVKIFDLYYQVDRKNIGSGIGLSLVNELVTLHQGKIGVTSNPGEGTSFFINLPYSKSVYDNGDFVEDKKIDIAQLSPELAFKKYFDKEIIKETEVLPEETTNFGLDDKIIMIIEDNQDLLYFMKNIIGKHYKVVTAENLEIGLEKAFEIIPDLIISDVMLPGKDGVEGCKIMKNDTRTCHIPYILLTAKSDVETKLKGLERGADDYIQKPFNFDELLARIKNLLIIKEKRCGVLKEKPVLRPVEVATNNLDEQFLNNILDIINENMQDSKFSISDLAKRVYLSQSQLYRKTLGLTGYTPHQFILTIRLQKAFELIKNKTATISEISYMVGFDSPAYFSKVFKDKYKSPPSEFFS